MSGWGALGDALGGGFNTDNAYETGRLRTAQTETALQQARNTQLKNMADEFQAKNQAGLQDALAAIGVNPNDPAAQATIINANAGAGYAATMGGNQTAIENRALGTLGDQFASPTAQRFAAQVAGHKAIDPLVNEAGTLRNTDMYQPNVAPTFYPTPETASKTAENYAQAQAAVDPTRHASANAGVDAETGMKIPNDFMVNPTRDLSKPYTADNAYFVPMPNTKESPTYSPPMGVRERQGVASVIHAGLESSQRLHTIVSMPYGANQGVISTSGQPGAGLAEALSKNVRWAMSPAEIQDYNVAASTLLRNLATLEIVGRYNPAKAALDSMDTLLFKKGEDTYTKMQKMADLRNIIENTMKTLLITYPNEKNTEIGQTARDTIASVQQSIPFTMDDVVAYRAASKAHPGITFDEAMRKHMLNKPVPQTGTAPDTGAAPASAAGRITASDGKGNTLVLENGQWVPLNGR